MQKTNGSKSKVFIVDDHQLFREGLGQMINREPDMAVCGEAINVDEAARAIEKTRPDMVVIDISLAESNGIDLVKSIRSRDNNLPILVISMHDESLYAERALRAGANGYVMKQEANKKVKEAIRKVLSGEVYL